MNYYIQGDAANADQIKAAFEKLGYDTTGHLFNAKSVLYFTLDGGIRATTCNCTPAIIKTHPDYKELELPVEPKFKVGDWVVRKDGETFYGGNYAEQITLIEVEEGDKRIWFSSKTWLRENDIRLWTIADAKDGDVLVTEDYIFIFKYILYSGVHLYCHYDIDDEEFDSDTPDVIIGNIHDKGAHFKPATKKQRDLLFAKIKEAGYEWDEKKKKLRKIKPHYDIANFHAGMPVLVRWYNTGRWRYSLYSFYEEDSISPFDTVKGSFTQCIPFEGNETLLGTTDMCNERFINW